MSQHPSILTSFRVNEGRFKHFFDELSAIGRNENGGIDRIAFSANHRKARTWFRQRASVIGLETKIDDAGNYSAILKSKKPDAPTLLIGSHLDAVPNGGAYDGALGVMAALEILIVLKEKNVDLRVNVEAIDLTDEEGYYVSYLGSKAITGLLTKEELTNSAAPLEDALTINNLSIDSIVNAKRDNLAGYLELHVEQGMLLNKQKANIGIVTSIVGIRTFKITFKGRADHSGTAPMKGRKNAALGASDFTLKAAEVATEEFQNAVVNIGDMEFSPGVFNVVPESVEVSFEFRADREETLNQMEKVLLEIAQNSADQFGLELETNKIEQTSPAPMNSDIQESFQVAAEQLNLTTYTMPSGAGHDSLSFASVCPTGMIFVPSVGGYSHSPQEHTEWQDCVNGANVLLQAVLKLS